MKLFKKYETPLEKEERYADMAAKASFLARLEEENIEITSEEIKRNAIRKFLDKELKNKCLDFFNQPISEDSAEILKNHLK